MINQNQAFYAPPQQEQFVQPMAQQSRPFPYYPVSNINEAYNWAVAPGSYMVFRDQDGIHFYTKSLASPYDKPMFEVYTKEPSVQQQTMEQTENDDNEIDLLKEDISKIKDALRKLNDKITDKKVGGK